MKTFAINKNLFQCQKKIITQHDFENKQLKEENERIESRKVESRKEENGKVESRKVENEKLKKENEQLKKNKVDLKIKKSVEKPIEIKSFKEDKNKFKEILAIIDSNKFNYRNKIGEFKYIDIRDLVNNIRNNTIGEIDVEKNLNTLNKIKNTEIIKHKRRTTKHKRIIKFIQ